MYTECTIQWVDDGSVWSPVIIKSNDEMDKNDDMIFFYGLNRPNLIEACHNREILEGEWRILFVGETYDKL